MLYYFAPLEGLTDRIFRQLHHRYFGGVDRYYTPFFSPTSHRALTAREARELPPAEQLQTTVIPQIMTKIPEDFLWLTQQCRDLGYQEVNLNLGCPSGTVTAKGKGSGMLRDTESLQQFLDEIFTGNALPISIKTRIGFSSPEEFPRLLEIYNQYPIKELTIHSRVRTAFYKGAVDMDAFTYAYEHSKCPLCYNGDLTSLQQIETFRQEFPGIEAVMIGRGLIADPGMLSPGTVAILEAFHNELLERYLEAFGGSRNAMFRLKENWHFLITQFEGSEKLWKQLRKTTDLGEFRAITTQIFHTLPYKNELA